MQIAVDAERSLIASLVAQAGGAGAVRSPAPQAAPPSTTSAQATANGAPAQGLLGTGPPVSPRALIAVQESERSALSPNRRSGEETDARGLTKEEQEEVARLRQTDREVRQHEQAHKNAAGPYAGAVQYQYVRGPDGQLYAVSGEVSIDTSEESSPEATIAKMEIVIKAALAPAEPSAQDRKVAQQARQALNEARADLAEEKREDAAEAERRREVLEAKNEALGIVTSATFGQGTAAYGAASAAIAGQTASIAFNLSA